MSNEQAVRDTLREMAKLSILSNKINDIQEKNLKAFPKVFFEGFLDGKIDYDLSHAALVDTEENKEKLELSYKFNGVDSKHFRVTYYLKMDETVQNTHLEKRFEALQGAVRTLFYSDVKIEVFFNDRKVFG